jgi:Fe-S-cluster containining protein
VLPHEALILRELAQSLERNVKFTPGYVVLDAKNEVRIALSYLMYLDPSNRCPFLAPDRSCMIHGLYKPLTCRSFPYLPRVIRYSVDPQDKSVDFTVEFVVSTLCPVTREYSRREAEAIVRSRQIAVRVMPNEARAALETIRARKMYAEALTVLWRSGIVELKGTGYGDGVHWPLVNGYEFIRRFIPTFTIGAIAGFRRGS